MPVAAGLAGVWLGPRFVDAAATPSVALESHFSYLSGLLLAIGVAFWSTILDIENRGGRFLLLTAIVLAGGFSRAVSLLRVGVPNAPMLFGIAMELLVTPALALWQARLARRAQLARPTAPTM